jgi:quercetin dioxygenase-like cupin family protein
MHPGHDSGLRAELHDGVFHVTQVTRDTPLESIVGADLVTIDAHQESSMHRHNHAETVLYFTAGAGEVLLTENRDVVEVVAGDRLLVGKGVYHSLRTRDAALSFLSVQSPPILDKSTGFRDLEPLD